MSTTTEGPQSGWPPDDSDEHAAGKQLRRPQHGRMVAGVAAAIARYSGIDVTIVRVAFAVLTVVGFTGLAYFASIPLYLGGIPLYLACWVLIPDEGDDQSIAGRFFASRRHSP